MSFQPLFVKKKSKFLIHKFAHKPEERTRAKMNNEVPFGSNIAFGFKMGEHETIYVRQLGLLSCQSLPLREFTQGNLSDLPQVE